jgi:hypothetical protein
MLKILTLMTVATLLLVFNLGETAIAQVTHQRERGRRQKLQCIQLQKAAGKPSLRRKQMQSW